MKKIVLFLLFIFTTIDLSAQDTLVYSQKNSVMFSNKYFLYPKLKTFEHKFRTDDGQLWYGKGKYEIKKGKLFLYFGDSEKEIKKMNRISKIYNKSKKSDTLFVRFFDEKYKEPLGHIILNGKYFFPSYENRIVKIAKSEFNQDENPSIEVYIQGTTVKIELIKLSELSTIEISAYDIYGAYHFESNFDRMLKYSRDILTSDDFYHTTRKRRVKFILENDKN